MNFLGERIVCDYFLKFLVALVETRELAEFGVPPVSLMQAALLQILARLLSKLHHCHKLAVNDNIYERDGRSADVSVGFAEVIL